MQTLSPEGYKVQAIVAPAFPDAVITKMEVGDWFEGEFQGDCRWLKMDGACATHGCIALNWDEALSKEYCIEFKQHLHGNLVEIKIEGDGGNHTEQLERMQDEFYRMSIYRQKNPYVCLHAVWCVEFCTDEEERTFYHLCFKYHIWGHLFKGDYEKKLTDFLKRLPRDSEYKEFEPFIKRSHEEPTERSKMIRQIEGVASDKAIACATVKNWEDYHDVFGRKKDGSPKKIAIDSLNKLYEFAQWILHVCRTKRLETGDAP